MATTKKAQIVREDAEGKKKTSTFNHVSAAADDTAIGECLDLYGGFTYACQAVYRKDRDCGP